MSRTPLSPPIPLFDGQSCSTECWKRLVMAKVQTQSYVRESLDFVVGRPLPLSHFIPASNILQEQFALCRVRSSLHHTRATARCFSWHVQIRPNNYREMHTTCLSRRTVLQLHVFLGHITIPEHVLRTIMLLDTTKISSKTAISKRRHTTNCIPLSWYRESND